MGGADPGGAAARGPDEHAARARALRGVARSARRDAAGGLAVRADRQPSRHGRGAAGRSCVALPRLARRRPRRARRGALRLRRRLRRDQRRRERAGPRARAAVRPPDPLLVPRRVQRRRARRRGPRRARQRRWASARGRTSERSRSCSSLVGARGRPPAAATGRATIRGRRGPSSARRGPCSSLGAAAFFTLLAEGAAADWSAVYLSHSLGATAAVAALGYTGFSLAMAASRLVGDRLNGRFGPVALARGGGLLAAAALALALVSGSTPAALARLRGHGRGPRRRRARCCSAPPARRRASRRASASRPSRRSAGSASSPGPPAIGFAAGAVGLRGALGDRRRRDRRAGAPRAERRPAAGRASAASCSSRRPCCPTSTACSSTPAPRSRPPGASFAERHGLDAEHVLAAEPRPAQRRPDPPRRPAPRRRSRRPPGSSGTRSRTPTASGRCPERASSSTRSRPSGFAIVTSGSRALAVARLRAAGLPVPERARHGRAGRGRQAGPGRLPARRGAARGRSRRTASCSRMPPPESRPGLAAGMTVIAVLTTNDESALRNAHRRVPDLCALLADRNGSRKTRRGPRRGASVSAADLRV